MRLIVLFDLPVLAKFERREAMRFRNYLLKDGYTMMQLSVYTRLCATIENATLHESRLMQNLPSGGSVRSMIITEKQFSSIKALVGKKRSSEKRVIENQISFF